MNKKFDITPEQNNYNIETYHRRFLDVNLEIECSSMLHVVDGMICAVVESPSGLFGFVCNRPPSFNSATPICCEPILSLRVYSHPYPYTQWHA